MNKCVFLTTLYEKGLKPINYNYNTLISNFYFEFKIYLI